MSEAIDWSAPIEAYHPDGRVVAVERAYGWCIRKHPSVDDARNWSFREDGTHGNSEWRIRNRKSAQQQVEFRTTVHGKPLTQRMIDAKIIGMVAKDDGWHASFDTVPPHSEPIGPAMMKYLLEPAPEGVTEHRWGAPLDPELVDRMAWVIRRLNHGAFVTDDNITTAIYDIAAELPPEPVDPVVARAREIVAGESDGSVATSFRSGERDSVPAMRAVIRALREGMGE